MVGGLNSRVRVGWLASCRFVKPWSSAGGVLASHWYHLLPPSTRMRVGNISRWINANDREVMCEIYNPARRYDVLVVVKEPSEEFVRIASTAKGLGVRVIYDANVNYWEVWGEYGPGSPRPTAKQQESARALTDLADIVVADSTYLGAVARRWHRRVYVIPDNVDLSVYRYIRTHEPVKRLRIVWSGMSHKCDHLGLITPVLEEMAEDLELVLVSERRPRYLDELPEKLPVEYVKFSDRRYAQVLSSCDVVISPKRLCNGYDLGHTEYKISLGMAAQLPAIASPQLSYQEAIKVHGGGLIAETVEDWLGALRRLRENTRVRARMGLKARKTVLERYSTPVVANNYLTVIKEAVK